MTPGNGGPGVTLVYGRYHALAGYGIADDQFVFGAGARIITLQVKSSGDTLAGVADGQTLLTLDGAGPEAGLVWKPNAYPFRVGTTFRSAVGATVAGFAGQVGGFLGESFGQGTSVGSTGSAATASGDVCPAGRERAGICRGFILPATATVPWELETGFAVQLGPRPMNPPWLNPREMERPVRDRITKTRAARQAEYARELASAPPVERATKQRAQAANEESLRGIEDQEMAAESARLRGIRKARYANWPRERITIHGEPSRDRAQRERGLARRVREPDARHGRAERLALAAHRDRERTNPELARPARGVVHRAVALRDRDGTAALHRGGQRPVAPFQPVGDLRGRSGLAALDRSGSGAEVPELRARIGGVVLSATGRVVRRLQPPESAG